MDTKQTYFNDEYIEIYSPTTHDNGCIVYSDEQQIDLHTILKNNDGAMIQYIYILELNQVTISILSYQGSSMMFRIWCLYNEVKMYIYSLHGNMICKGKYEMILGERHMCNHSRLRMDK